MSLTANTMSWSITCSGDKAVDKVTLDQQLYDDDHIEVILKTIADGTETTLTKTTDYSVSGVPGASAIVTTVSDYSSAYQLHVRRVAVLTQVESFVAADSFPSAVVEKIFDKKVMDTQVNNDEMRRAVKWAKTSTLRDLDLADPANNAGKAIGVNAAGDGLLYITTSTLADADLNDLLNAGFSNIIYPQSIELNNAGLKIIAGSGTPEASVVADVGSIYLRTNGGVGTSIYFKESGVSNTGWVGRGTNPSFAAYLASTQIIGSTSSTKIEFDTEVYDTNSDYDNITNYRYTPTVDGKYLVISHADIFNCDTANFGYNIKKNGAIYAAASNFDGSSDRYISISAIIDMNGTTDYLEMFVQSATDSSYSVQGGSTNSRFEAIKVG